MTWGSEIERILVHLREGETRLSQFMITYSDGVEEHRGGTLQDASELAAEHSLVMVPASGGWFQWVRDHEAWWDPR